jgi:hypothetical protein
LVSVHVNEQVKLDPSMVDAWCCLGNCFWKKGDLVQAKNCFNIALSKVSILFPIFVFRFQLSNIPSYMARVLTRRRDV